MKGHRVWVVYNVAIVLAAVITMVVFNYSPSWSQYALTAFGMLLTIALRNISVIFRDRSYLHPLKLTLLFLGIRREHLDRATSEAFFLIMITPVTLLEAFPQYSNNDLFKYIVYTHYIATFTGLFLAYIGIYTYYKKYSQMWYAMFFSMIICSMAFIWAVISQQLWYKGIKAPYTIGFGELMASLPVIIYILESNGKKVYNSLINIKTV